MDVKEKAWWAVSKSRPAAGAWRQRAALICCARGEHGSNQIMMKDQPYFGGEDIVTLMGTWPSQSSKIGCRAVSCSSTQQGYTSRGAAGEQTQHGCALLSHFQQVPQKPDGHSVHWPISSCEPRRWKRGADRREWMSSAPRDTGAFFLTLNERKAFRNKQGSSFKQIPLSTTSATTVYLARRQWGVQELTNTEFDCFQGY